MKNTNGVGALTEGRVLTGLIAMELIVALPFGVARYDLIVDLPTVGLKPVQCKTGRLANGVIVYNRATSHRRDSGYVQRSYVGDADYFGIFCPETDKVYLVPVDSRIGKGHLRVESPLDNRKVGVQWASNFEIDVIVAQLGE